MTDYLPSQLNELVPWLKNFDTTAQSYRGQFELHDAALAQIGSARALLEQLTERLHQAEGAAWEAERAAARAEAELAEAELHHAEAVDALGAAVAAKDVVFSDAVNRVRPIVERLQAHEDTSKPVPRQMGSLPGASFPSVPAPSPSNSSRLSPSMIRLAAPADLAVTAQQNRTNVLQWSGLREPGTRYLIEAAIGKLYRGSSIAPETSAYKLVATVTDETTYRHVVGPVPVGVQVKYRIRAGRDTLVSGFSAEVVVICK